MFSWYTLYYKIAFCYDSLWMMSMLCIKYIHSPHRMMCFWLPPTTTRPTRRRRRSWPVGCCSRSAWWTSSGCRGRSCWSRATPPWGRGRVVPTAPTTPQVGVDRVNSWSKESYNYQSYIYMYCIWGYSFRYNTYRSKSRCRRGKRGVQSYITCLIYICTVVGSIQYVTTINTWQVGLDILKENLTSRKDFSH